MNRRGIADLLLLRTLSAIYQKSREPSFWEVIDSFGLLAYESLAVLRTLLQWLLARVNFTLDPENLFCWYKQKGLRDWYENFSIISLHLIVHISIEKLIFLTFDSIYISIEKLMLDLQGGR